MEDEIEDIKDAIRDLRELATDLRDTFSGEDGFDDVDDFVDELMDKVEEIEDHITTIKDEGEELYEKLQDAEADDGIPKYRIPIPTLEDEMKMELLHGLFNKYSLVQLEKLRDGAQHAIL